MRAELWSRSREGPRAAGGRKAAAVPAEGPGLPRRMQGPLQEAQRLLALAPKRAHPQAGLAGKGWDGASAAAQSGTLVLPTPLLFRATQGPPKGANCGGG